MAVFIIEPDGEASGALRDLLKPGTPVTATVQGHPTGPELLRLLSQPQVAVCLMSTESARVLAGGMNEVAEALRERVKELRLLHGASRALHRGHGSSMAQRLRDMVSLIPSGWQRPELTAARIVAGDHVVATPGFRETPWLLEASALLPEGSAVRLEVVLTEAPPAGRPPFLPEEREMIDALASMVADAVHHDRLSRLHSQTVASVSEAVIIVGALGNRRVIMEANPAAERMFQQSREDLIGQVPEILHPDAASFRTFRDAAHRALRRTSGFGVETTLVRADGTTFDAEVMLRFLEPDKGLKGGTVGFIRDVSVQRQLEARVQESLKLEAVGRLASGIAHDFNNILTVIRSQADLLRLNLEDTEHADDIAVIQTAARRARALTEQLLAFSRDQVLQPEVVDVRDTLRGLDRIIEKAVGERVSVTYDAGDDVLPVLMDRSRLEQVIMNLAINARDAMPEGGALTFRVRSGQPPGSDIVVTVLEVADTGVGMTDEVRRRAFEPYYTTKPAGAGTGLGLATVYGFVIQCGGTVDVETEPGAGTLFRLTLPAVMRAETAAAAAQATAMAATAQEAATTQTQTQTQTPTLATATGPETAGSRAGRSRRILVVDDDAQVRRVACTILRRAGHHVAECPDAEACLQRLDTDATWDLVLTDVGLPGMSGRQLAEVLQNRAGAPAVVVTSGYDAAGRDGGGELPPGVMFLPKPFSRADLLDAVTG